MLFKESIAFSQVLNVEHPVVRPMSEAGPECLSEAQAAFRF